MTTLLVDDSPDTRLLLHKILRDAGYRDTLSASSAHDAFKYLDLGHAGAGANEIDLIVMDVRMPEIDGIEAGRCIKAVEALRDIPIIMITARSQQEALRAAFDAVATDYIKKPFEEVELLARIKAALKLKKEIDARQNWEQELSKTISELDAALHEIVTLQQLIPICPARKKSLADQTSQSAPETYIQIHPNAKFHYTVCSSCLTRKG
jgi:sigma-B regulation protein RsbU (phosphoserine phosphatase)